MFTQKIKKCIKVIPYAKRIKHFLTAPRPEKPEKLSSEIQKKLALLKKEYSEPDLENPISQLVTQSQVESDVFKRWCEEIKETPRCNRKLWEYVYVLQCLHKADKLKPGIIGLGFGVGKEPLPALMAKYGCSVVATDMDESLANEIGWVKTNQHSTSTKDLNSLGICEQEPFERLVSFITADMNKIDPKLKESKFDFIWSCCSVDHLGSIELSKKFLIETAKMLKPDGVSVHTTEYNVLSNTKTLDNTGIIIFRRKDIESLQTELDSMGYTMTFNLHTGSGKMDMFVDMPPYVDNHLKLYLAGYVSTSVGFMIKQKENRAI